LGGGETHTHTIKTCISQATHSLH